MTSTTEFLIHSEADDEGHLSWWAEGEPDAVPYVPYTAASGTLHGIHDLCRESCEIEDWPPPLYKYCACTEGDQCVYNQ